jgi:hypothetical protein
MNPATEMLLRRAACQAVSLVRQNTRCVVTERRLENSATDAIINASENTSQLQDQKTIQDLPGPSGYPVIGTAPEYFRKPNRGQMHEVQVGVFLLFSLTSRKT